LAITMLELYSPIVPILNMPAGSYVAITVPVVET
jgi:hypothetical protein